MSATRTNVEFAKRIFADRVGNDYVYGGNWDPLNVKVGTDCSGLVIDELDAAVNGTAMAWSRHGMSTESWRPIDVGEMGTIFNTICVASPNDFPADAAVKIAIHHGPGGGANSHMWCEVDGIRMESNGSDGCVTGSRARSVYDTGYANDWHYLPGPVVDGPVGPDPVRVLSDVMGASVPMERYRQLYPALAQCLTDCGCTSVPRIAMWDAQIGHESVGLLYMEEQNWSGGTQTDAQYFAKYDNRADLGNNQPGDGLRFKGRGPIQVTGRHNYTVLSQWAFRKGLVPSPTFFVDNPSQLASDAYGFIGVAWYWTTQRPMNDAADARDVVRATQYINGGQNGTDDRRTRYNRALAMGDALLTLTNGDDDMFTNDDRDLLNQIAGIFRPSLSPLRHLGEGNVNTCAGFAQTADALGHPQFVAMAAKYGHRDSIALLAEVAGADPTKYPDRVEDSKLAKAILADIEATNPAALQQFITQNGARS
ncbi:glycoside hydrolase family 19 protein [Mycobacteroides abscessus]|uniref:glycoside hydrolase family 19 protein n=1 Tax=Mycobacteroides abscessus TaxID=36809 RepID=UPI000929D9F5|nr:chitinase [Mycobacteroides abscessus]QSM04928.1 lysin A [Mycobacterium phage prophi91-4]MDO3335173.1 chitinase [Mycobacteroides abscessus subsp. bolletii]QSM87793.1 chitinase [Mycobacteroides abscessus subsp. bolletii]SIB02351.1 Bacteriophage protein [Mycobacteroides abscessus subsp. bolletii]SII68830.1 Bacteriophage protein [Mycobacteroides abscessus subsp. bolletii]